jgi:hypothetical protein
LYEAIASNDSILHVVSMSEVAESAILKNYIDTLKKKDEAKRILEKLKESKRIERNSKTTSINPAISAQDIESQCVFAACLLSMNALNTTASVFYFIILRPFLLGK